MITLSDLPPPPPGKTGWPWTEAGPVLPDRRPDGSAWPAISIVTPSFNQGQFLEETIRSILLQSYPALEYIIIDGGSSDDSVAIIRRYAPWLKHWQSAPDGGQADAVNIGLRHCTGEIFNFINSDDVLLPGALATVGALEAPFLGLAGRVINRGPAGDEVFVHGRMTLAELLRQDHFHQPGIWLRRDAVVATGGFDASYHYCFDKKFYLRFLALHEASIATSPQALVVFRLHDTSKTTTSHASFRAETLRAIQEVLPDISGADERALAGRVIARIERENERDSVLLWAADLLSGPKPPLSARLNVLARLFGGAASGKRIKLLEMLLLGSDEARRRSLARKARRADAREKP